MGSNYQTVRGLFVGAIVVVGIAFSIAGYNMMQDYRLAAQWRAEAIIKTHVPLVCPPPPPCAAPAPQAFDIHVSPTK